MSSGRMDYTGTAKWDTTSGQYTSDVALATAQAAPRLIHMADAMSPLNDNKARAIDLGAGTGSLSLALAKLYPSLQILATDFSPQMVERLDEEVARMTANDHVETKVLDMTDPITESTPEQGFTHVFSTMAIQFIEGSTTETLQQWMRLLRPGGVVAIGVWEMNDEFPMGGWVIWEAAAKAVDPSYVLPVRLPDGALTGHRDLFAAMTNVGLEQVTVENLSLGFNHGAETFMKFFWDSGNPMPEGLMSTFKGDLGEVKLEMRRVLREKYEDGFNIPLYAGLAVGRKPL